MATRASYQKPHARPGSGSDGGGSRKAGGAVRSDEACYLAEADLYILTPQMCDVVTQPHSSPEGP
jgi:hypothetical protein